MQDFEGDLFDWTVLDTTEETSHADDDDFELLSSIISPIIHTVISGRNEILKMNLRLILPDLMAQDNLLVLLPMLAMFQCILLVRDCAYDVQVYDPKVGADIGAPSKYCLLNPCRRESSRYDVQWGIEDLMAGRNLCTGWGCTNARI